MNLNSLRKIGGIIGVSNNKKPVEFSQDGYYCEECEEIFDDETLWDKKQRKFLCQQCKNQLQK